MASWLADTVLVDRMGVVVPLSKVASNDLIAVSMYRRVHISLQQAWKFIILDTGFNFLNVVVYEFIMLLKIIKLINKSCTESK